MCTRISCRTSLSEDDFDDRSENKQVGEEIEKFAVHKKRCLCLSDEPFRLSYLNRKQRVKVSTMIGLLFVNVKIGSRWMYVFGTLDCAQGRRFCL